MLPLISLFVAAFAQKAFPANVAPTAVCRLSPDTQGSGQLMVYAFDLKGNVSTIPFVSNANASDARTVLNTLEIYESSATCRVDWRQVRLALDNDWYMPWPRYSKELKTRLRAELDQHVSSQPVSPVSLNSGQDCAAELAQRNEMISNLQKVNSVPALDGLQAQVKAVLQKESGQKLDDHLGEYSSARRKFETNHD